jgi:hypothetical protein
MVWNRVVVQIGWEMAKVSCFHYSDELAMGAFFSSLFQESDALDMGSLREEVGRLHTG